MSAAVAALAMKNPLHHRENNGPKAQLLHGYLHIKIIRARKLRNMDCLMGCRTLATFLPAACSSDVSDPYVTAHAVMAEKDKSGKKLAHRLLKTTAIMNNLNPEWNEEFFLPIAHVVESIEFRIKDVDFFNLSTDKLGLVRLDVKEIVRLDDKGDQMRTGVHKLSHVDEKPSHGTLEFYLEYIPAKMWLSHFSGVDVPGTYFKPKHEENLVKLYVDADDKGEAPKVVYGPDNTTYEPPRCWRDTYDSMCEATRFIYVVGWSVDVSQSLLRGDERKEAEANNKYSPNIGELLKKKSNEGVIVNILVWDDRTSNNLNKEGAMMTKDEYLRSFCDGTNINLCLAPMVGGDDEAVTTQMRNSIIFTHHQKCVICDKPDNTVIAYMGGIDLTCGRFDDRRYPLFRTLQSDHGDDFYNGCAALQKGGAVGPRQPWHDIHLCVRGPGVLDLMENFHERWSRQSSHLVDRLVDLKALGLSANPPQVSNDKVWSTQLLRSIDARTAKFSDKVLSKFKTQEFDDIKGVTFISSEETAADDDSVSLRQEFHKLRAKAWKHRQEFTRRFAGSSAEGFYFNRTLSHAVGRDIDNSVQCGLVHHIRRAQHTIYIESQYFLSSSHLWPKDQNTKCYNLVAAELMLKISQKIKEGKRFAAYILIPMWPEGIPESDAIQAILQWQANTIQGLYIGVADAIRKKQEEVGKDMFDYKPTDYVNFYCLGTRETEAGSQATSQPAPNTKDEQLHKSRRHQVYVHSKMMIVDDAVVCIGSANINQRSLDGARDSELIQCSWQPKHMPTAESVANGDVHAFRMHCWAHVTGQFLPEFSLPSSLECVRAMNAIAERNWNAYASDVVTDMDSVLLPYPILVDEDGKVVPRTSNDCFPDTTAKVLGSKSGVIPEVLTT